MASDSAQGAVAHTFDSTGPTIALQRVGTASAWTGRSATELEGILADVFDASTGTLRVAEV